MDKYWPDGCLPVVCGFSSPDHTALKLALLYCLSESKVEACNGNGTSGMSSLVDKTIKVYCDAASRDSIAVDSVNSTGTMTTTVALVTGLVSSVLSAQVAFHHTWIHIPSADITLLAVDPDLDCR